MQNAARRGRACRYDVIKITLGFTACRLITAGRSDTILAMINTNENKLVSTKYTFICDPDACDCLIEVTSSDVFGFPSGVTELTCPCGRKTTLMSVVSATINPTTKKEEIMDISTEYNPDLIVTYKEITDGSTEYITAKVNEVEWKLREYRQLRGKMIENNNKLATLESIIISAYDNSNDQDTLTSIADLFNIELTKQIEFNATIEVNGIMRVPLNEGFDLETMLSDELSVSSYGNDVDILDYSIFEVSGSY